MIVHVIMANLDQIFKVVEKKYHNKGKKSVRRNNLFSNIMEDFGIILTWYSKGITIRSI